MTLSNPVTRGQIIQRVNGWLMPERFKDYCPNGLQVEGAPQVRSLVSGVTASLALIEAAAAHGADTLLVHHGLFWRGQDGTLTGWMRARVGLLIKHNLNLLAYHLPLDAHPEMGNNAQLALKLGFQTQSNFGEQNLGHMGVFSETQSSQKECTARDFAVNVERVLEKAPVLIDPNPSKVLRRVAWCTGGAQSWFEEAIKAGADIFVTGEISEPQAHLARESGVAYLACGHHATERYGVQALGEALARDMGVLHKYIEVDNPA